jgi:hypothetical protein
MPSCDYDLGEFILPGRNGYTFDVDGLPPVNVKAAASVR